VVVLFVSLTDPLLDTYEHGVHQISLYIHHSFQLSRAWFRCHKEIQTTFSRSSRVCACVCVCVHMRVCVCARVHAWCMDMCVHAHVYMHVVCTHVCIHVCVCAVFCRSERVGKTGVTGTLLTEAKSINNSLHFLEMVRQSRCMHSVIYSQITFSLYLCKEK